MDWAVGLHRLPDGGGPEVEALAASLRWAQEDVRYIGGELGDGSFAPRRPDTTVTPTSAVAVSDDRTVNDLCFEEHHQVEGGWAPGEDGLETCQTWQPDLFDLLPAGWTMEAKDVPVDTPWFDYPSEASRLPPEGALGGDPTDQVLALRHTLVLEDDHVPVADLATYTSERTRAWNQVSYELSRPQPTAASPPAESGALVWLFVGVVWLVTTATALAPLPLMLAAGGVAAFVVWSRSARQRPRHHRAGLRRPRPRPDRP